jgi:hypothetical protein
MDISGQEVYRHDPYVQAGFVSMLNENGVLVVSDYDGTQTTGAEIPSPQELDNRLTVVKIAEKIGAVKVAVSARNHGLMMSEEMFDASVANGLKELRPRWHKNPATGKYEYVDPSEVPFFKHNTDWDILASFGRGIVVRNGRGYLVDRVFDAMLRFDVAEGEIDTTDQLPWRNGAIEFIFEYFPQGRKFMAPIEFASKYHKGETNVAPLDFRVQFNFPGVEGYAAMLELKEVIQRQKEDISGGPRFATRLKVVDESRLDPDPERCVYVVYLVPWHARKESMINRILYQACRAAKRAVKDTRVFYAGDTLTDLRAGLYGGGDATTTFLLATGSRLAPYILEKRSQYGAEDLSFLWGKPEKNRKTHRLTATNKKGVYRFVHKIRGTRINTVVIGDERYPDCTPPGSVAQFLEEFATTPAA